jgi:hypothetical protein
MQMKKSGHATASHEALLPTSLAASLLALSPMAALAGPTVESPAAEKSSGDWCEWLQNKPGLLYSNKENPYFQSFQLGGRFMYQTAYVDGEDVNGRDFNDTYDEYRRVRLESKAQFLNYFSTKVSINIVSDGRSAGEDLDWGYDTFDEATITFDIKKAFGAGALETLSLTYGRHKFNMTEEVHMSSKEIPTIERSAIANKLYGANSRPTGFTLDGSLGKWSATLGLFSGEDDSEFIGGWNDGQAYYLSAAHQTNEQLRFVLDFVKNDPSGNDDYLGYDWATALNGIYENGRFGAITTLVLGENNSATASQDGNFHALVVMPWYYLMEDRLQAVVQYQYAGASEAEGIRTNSRYFRSEHSAGVDVNSGRGDELHTLYAGLNYFLCGHNAKIMGGVEYASLDTPNGDASTLTYQIAFRTFF